MSAGRTAVSAFFTHPWAAVPSASEAGGLGVRTGAAAVGPWKPWTAATSARR
ncbi:hypothetical protein [Kitasatospora arboriphila]|uniref:hypothetical protein n=1 Tax=Kitasatospora arboriphila TaxID=258052 RepID=UPI0031DB1848